MLEVRNISFAYADTPVIDRLSFAVSTGSHISVIGESGCGKSTLLKLIYGLYDVAQGHIFLDGTEVSGPKSNLVPGHESMKYLAQDFDLMPFVTVRENVGKFLSNMHPEDKAARVGSLLEIVEMSGFADVKAQFLSGGQQQRVALARALALEPRVLLLDEPFSQVDAFRANRLRRNLYSYLKSQKITCIVATHDASDVLSFSDETLAMRNGRLVAQNHPQLLYRTPPDKDTASLFGDANEIEARLLDPSDGSGATVFVYPHQLKMTERSPLRATVFKSYFAGNGFLVEAVCEKGKIYFRHHAALPAEMLVHLRLAQ
jgi:ABC-type Fe3+/spermidine/putrescine transport system ATPase subunit